jgi:hypothetical protein
MNCPKCKSSNVVDGTAGTLRCADCDYAFVPYNTAPRMLGAGMKKNETSPVGIMILVFLIILIAAAVGFVSPLLAVVIAVLALLFGIFFYLSKLSNGRR